VEAFLKRRVTKGLFFRTYPPGAVERAMVDSRERPAFLKQQFFKILKIHTKS
jgi:hypothetical protein